jgi:hypothetical protein
MLDGHGMGGLSSALEEEVTRAGKTNMHHDCHVSKKVSRGPLII